MIIFIFYSNRILKLTKETSEKFYNKPHPIPLHRERGTMELFSKASLFPDESRNKPFSFASSYYLA
jgi:hypothetical protein